MWNWAASSSWMWRVAGAAAGMVMVPKTRSSAASFFRNGAETNVAKLRP